MNILICDDIKEEAQKLQRLINASGVKASSVIYTDGCEALEYILSGASVDVCFFDIHMPVINGVQLAEESRAGGFKGEIVFLTVSNNYAAESYRVNAFSYLLKPPSPEEVEAVLRKLAMARASSDNRGILLKASGLTRFLMFREISHVEVVQHKVYFYLSDGLEINTYATFSEFAPQLLKDSRFMQCHRSYIVNLNEISHARKNDFVMRFGAKIPISRGYPEAKKQYMKWVLEKSWA